MDTKFQEVPEVIADERFLAWYFRENEQAVNNWEQMMEGNPDLRDLSIDAAAFLKNLPAKERKTNNTRL